MMPMRWAFGAVSVAVIAIAVIVAIRAPERVTQDALISAADPAVPAAATSSPILVEPPPVPRQAVIKAPQPARVPETGRATQVQATTPEPSTGPLEVGRLAETVTITAEAPVVDT